MRNIFIFFVILAIAVPLIGQSITVLETIPGFINAQECRGHRGYVYILDRFSVVAYDCASASFVDTLNLGEYVRSIDFSDDYAVVVGVSSSFLIDVSDPSAMTELDFVSNGDATSSGWDVAISDEKAYIAAQARVLIYDISGGSFSLLGAYFPGGVFPMARAVAIEDSILYAGNGEMGVYGVNVANPLSTVVRSSADSPGSTLDLRIADDILVCSDGSYVGIDTSSVLFFDISSPSTLTEIGRWTTSDGECRKSHIVGHRLALADGSGGVKIIDFSDPTDPYQVAHQPTTDDVKGIYVIGDSIFAAGMNNFYIMETDAFVPETTDYEFPEIISVAPNEEVIACLPSVRWTIETGTSPIEESSVEIAIDDDSYTAMDPEVTVGSSYIGFDGTGISGFSAGDTIIVSLEMLADDAGSLAIGLGMEAEFYFNDVTPEIYDRSPGIGDTISADSVYISASIGIGPFSEFVEDSFFVRVNGINYSTSSSYLDLTYPDFTVEPLGSFDPGDSVNICVKLSDDVPEVYCGPNMVYECWTFYIGSTDIDEYSTPEKFDCSISPNPYNSMCKIEVVGIQDACQIEIYNTSGNLIRRFDNITNSILWDGTDSHSNPVSSGIYLIDIRSGGKSIRRKAILVQ